MEPTATARQFGNNPTERIEHGPIDHMRGRETHVAEGFQIGGAVAEVEIPVGEHERPVGKTLEETVEGDRPQSRRARALEGVRVTGERSDQTLQERLTPQALHVDVGHVLGSRRKG